jgi:hypothetical protein
MRSRVIYNYHLFLVIILVMFQKRGPGFGNTRLIYVHTLPIMIAGCGFAGVAGERADILLH